MSPAAAPPGSSLALSPRAAPSSARRGSVVDEVMNRALSGPLESVSFTRSTIELRFKASTWRIHHPPRLRGRDGGVAALGDGQFFAWLYKLVGMQPLGCRLDANVVLLRFPGYELAVPRWDMTGEAGCALELFAAGKTVVFNSDDIMLLEQTGLL